MHDKQALIIFLKYPQPGKVKTRLAKNTNDFFAAEVYRFCTERIMNEVRKNSRDYSVFIFYGRYDHEDKYKSWLNSDFEYRSQSGGDLGDKMLNAIKFTLESGYDKALLIGTDIPDMNHRIITNAFAELKENSVVLIPALDGGYVGIGMKAAIPEIFEGINWGTGNVIGQTIRKIRITGRKFSLLEPLLDLDTENDMRIWLNENRNENGNHNINEDELYKLILNYYDD